MITPEMFKQWKEDNPVTVEVLKFNRERLREVCFRFIEREGHDPYQSGKLAGYASEIRVFMELTYEDLFPQSDEAMEAHLERKQQIDNILG